MTATEKMSTLWILLDIDTNDLHASNYPLELGAQLMNVLKPEGTPFRRWLNHNQEFPRSAQG